VKNAAKAKEKEITDTTVDITAGITKVTATTPIRKKATSAIVPALVGAIVVVDAVVVAPAAVIKVLGDASSPKKKNGKNWKITRKN